jgi:hypothetical protein
MPTGPKGEKRPADVIRNAEIRTCCERHLARSQQARRDGLGAFLSAGAR